MDARLQLRVQRYGWDRASPVYERFWARQLRPAHDALLAAAALHPGERVLDVAAGTGLVTFRAAEQVGKTGAAVGVDLSESMVAGSNAEGGRRGADVRFQHMNAEALVFEDASFDAAICALGLMYVPDPGRALAEMLRVVRPGGRIVASVWGARTECGWAAIFPIVERRVQSDVCPLFFQLGTRDVLRDVMEAHGAQDVELTRISTTLRYASADEALGAAFAGGPVALAYSRFGEQERASAHAEYLDSIAPYRDGGAYSVPGTFVIARGNKPLA